ncbi:MAG: transcription termination factor NusA [Bdellovibrionales bacterium]
MAADNVFSDISRIIDALGKDKGIDKDLVINAVQQGMLAAAKKKYGTYQEIEAQYNEDSGEVELYQFKEVVTDEAFVDDEVEIKMTEALELDPEAQLGDSIGIKLDVSDLGRISAQLARQIITQNVRDAERDIIFAEFEQRQGEIASGIARRVERGSIVVDMGKTEAYIPYKEQIPGEVYKPGDRIQGYISEVRQTTRGPQIIMSRADSRYLMKLFEGEVPEIEDGIIQLVTAAREPGQRAKLAVTTTDPTVDPVGACVGVKGSRVQNVVQELAGEKIDIVPYEEDVALFVCNALQPAEISKVFMDEENNEMEVVVPDDQLSLAIGRRGQNVRLASKLTGWRLDILSESDAGARTAEAIFNLLKIEGMSETMAHSLFQSGFGSLELLSQSAPEHVMHVPGYEEEEHAVELIKKAGVAFEQHKIDEANKPKEEVVEGAPAKTEAAPKAASASGKDAKSLADERLKEQLAELDGDAAPVEAAKAEDTAAETSAD